MLFSELNKLLATNKTVSKKLIDDLTEPVPQSSIFDLLEAAFAGNHKRMLELYDEQRRQNVEPQAIIALLAWQLHVIAVCVWAGDQSAQDIARNAKINPYVVQKSMSLARGLQKHQVKTYINRLLELDEATKTSAVQVDDALQAYLLSL
jgi:DNA polymerase III delta subunit